MNEVNLFRDYLCQNGMDPAFENLPKEGLNLQLRNFLFDCRCLKAIKRFENLIIFSLSWILGAQGWGWGVVRYNKTNVTSLWGC